jgi:hypothetical protein
MTTWSIRRELQVGRSIVVAFAILTSTSLPFTARADEPLAPPPPPAPLELAPAPAPQEMEPEAPKPKPPQYSLPWQLRPVTAGTVVRSDTSFAKYENAASLGGISVASTLLASYRIPGTGAAPGTGLAPLVRFAIVGDSPPSGTGGVAIVNPLVGASYALVLGGGFRASAFFGATIPVGMGGGNTPDAGALDARKQGPAARAAMDNALFAVNDFTVIPGVDVAWVHGGFTAQAEATLFQLTRVRGAGAQPESAKTNFTCGLHLGWFALDSLSIGAELRYQRWLNAPIAVDKDATHASEDNLTIAFGPRFHLPIGEKTYVRPGLAFARAVDKPMASAAQNYDILQLDVPFVF